tara:strand:+ start:127 stop:846 length:720 start_codon:yes stop_codon:yes gene_type:complete
MLGGLFDSKSGDNADMDKKLGDSSAANKMKLLKGYEGLWIKLRRNTCWYLTNKIFSISIGVAFAVITIMFKRTTQVYMVQELKRNESMKIMAAVKAKAGAKEADLVQYKPTYEAYHILTIYWFLFIYFSLAAMDELIEAFSVINQMEKGALGLFFELNYIIGLFLTVYITWFVQVFKAPTPTGLTGVSKTKMDDDFHKMYMWLYINYWYLIFCVLMSLIVACIFKKMDTKAKHLAKVGN